MVIHCMKEDNVAGKILQDTRDMCNSEGWAFEVTRKKKSLLNKSLQSMAPTPLRHCFSLGSSRSQKL